MALIDLKTIEPFVSIDNLYACSPGCRCGACCSAKPAIEHDKIPNPVDDDAPQMYSGFFLFIQVVG